MILKYKWLKWYILCIFTIIKIFKSTVDFNPMAEKYWTTQHLSSPLYYFKNLRYNLIVQSEEKAPLIKCLNFFQIIKKIFSLLSFKDEHTHTPGPSSPAIGMSQWK